MTQHLAYIRWFLFTAALGLQLLAALNVLVDPTGVWGTGILPPAVWEARQEKTELYQQQQTPPQVVILGSSRSMKVEPEYVRQITGKPAFNFGVNSARSEDIYVITRFLVGTNTPPSALIVGLDLEAFHNAVGVDQRLTRTSELAQYLRFSDRYPVWGDKLTDAISHRTTRLSLASIWRSTRSSETSPKTRFGRDGLLTYVDTERAIREGTFDFEAAVRRSEEEYLRRFAGYTSLAPWRVEYFEQFLKTARKNGIDVSVYLTPLHPEVIQVLYDRTNFRRLLAELRALLLALKAKYHFRYLDASTITGFGGDPSAFYDGAHPMEENNRRLIRVLLEQR